MNRSAVIDVGTNSVKLLVAEVSGQNVHPVCEESEQTRLGRGFYENQTLQPNAISETAKAVADYCAKAKIQGARSIRIIATSAARDAVNREELINSIEQSAGLPLEIISGEQEADWAFRGVTSSPEFSEHPLLILDVGGGSTEFIIGEKRHTSFRHSFNIGSVRLFEKLRPSDPPQKTDLAQCRQWIRNFLAEEVSPKLRPALETFSGKTIQLVGTGGTSTILARMENKMDDYNREKIESTRLSMATIRNRNEALWAISFADRQNIPGLPPKRADVILTGISIFEAVMETFGFSELRVSTRGLRFAALMK